MNENRDDMTIGEMPTLGREKPSEPEVRAEGASWSETEMSRAETLRPPEGIRDDGRTDAARRWTPGETILDRYVVERELGQGGMGVVYGCLDKVGGVRVAVKCLPPELSHNSVEMEEVRENFQLVYGLSHPNIAGARHLERDGSGVYYLVMEEAAGENLRRWLRAKWKAGGVKVAEAIPILRQVASALDYAHSEKVVHRDVKPGNVMIDARRRVKVLDFGLASQIRTSLSRASHAYRGTSGTGPYMAPEQWRGRRQDGKTDQYALGVMAYEMLAGHLPFENDEVSVLREVVLKEEPEDIPGVPDGAMAAIRRAMSKSAADRFPDCGAFVDALEQGGASRGGASRPGEPVKGTTAGTAAGRPDGKPAGRTARPEGSPHQQTTARRDGSPHQGLGETERVLKEAQARAEAERAARLLAETEAKEARRKARAEELAAQRAQEARGRATGWAWFLAIVLLLGGLAAYGWWQQEQERSQAQVRRLQQEAETQRKAKTEAETKWKAETEAQRRAQAEAEAKWKAEADMQRRAQAEATRKVAAEAKAEKEARQELERQWAEAEVQRKAPFQVTPPNETAEATLHRARNLLLFGADAAALDTIRSMSEADRASIPAKLLEGTAFLRLQRYSEAIAALAPAALANPRHAELQAAYGAALIGAKRYDEARNTLARAVSLDQNPAPETYANLAMLCAFCDPVDLPRARRYYELAREAGLPANPQLEERLR